MQDNKKLAEYNENRDGTVHLRGHHAVDPEGHLVLLAADSELPDEGWRWATHEDLELAAAAEKARASEEKAAAPGGPLKANK